MNAKTYIFIISGVLTCKKISKIIFHKLWYNIHVRCWNLSYGVHVKNAEIYIFISSDVHTSIINTEIYIL